MFLKAPPLSDVVKLSKYTADGSMASAIFGGLRFEILA